MAQSVSKTTTDHDTIRKWAEERGAWPAQAASTGQGGQTGIIRIDFPGYTGEGKLERISWDEWFRKFDESKLALVYEETTAGGQRSNFNKLVERETAETRRERAEAAPRAAESPKVREEGERAATKARRPRAAKAEKGGVGAARGGGRRQTSRGAAARTAGRAGARGKRGGGRKAPQARGRTRKAASRGGRRGTGRPTRRR